jgi:HEAT repeat protein
LLRCLEREAVRVDAAVPYNLLTQARGSEVADYARLAEDFFFSRREEDRLRRAGGDPLTEAGEWTRFMGQGGVSSDRAEAEDLEQAAVNRLTPLVDPLKARLAEGGDIAEAALRVLARIRLSTSLDAIMGGARSGLLAPACLGALSVFGGREAALRGLEMAQAVRRTPVFKDLIYSFRSLPEPEVFQFLTELAPKENVQSQVASALEGFASFDHASVLEISLRSRDPWTLVQAIETMGRIGGPTLTRQIGVLFERVEHPLVRVACLQAVAETGAREGVQVAMAGLACPDPGVKAAAVEALVALPVARNDYRDRVLALLDTPHPKLAMNTALACVVLNPGRSVQRVQKLISSGSASHLLQGIHCLAYMEDRASPGILHAIIGKAPAGPIRIQAVRSLGRRASRDPQAVGTLANLVKSPDPAVRMTAAWFLAGCHYAARKGASGVLAQAVEGENLAVVRAVDCEALGLCGPAAIDASRILGRCLGLGGQVARSAGWSLATAFPDSPESRLLKTSGDVSLQARACLQSWYSGGEGVEQMAELLRSCEEDVFLDVAMVARSLAESACFVGTGPTRLKPLAEKLSLLLREGGSGVTVGGAVPEMAPLMARGRTGQQAAVQNLGVALEPQPQRINQGGERLPSEQAAEQALKDLPSMQEAAEAIEQASYYQPEPSKVAQSAATRMASAEALGVGDALGAEESSEAVSPSLAPSANPTPASTPAVPLPASAAPVDLRKSQSAVTMRRKAPDMGAGVPRSQDPGSGGRFKMLRQGLELVAFFGVAILIGRLFRMLIDTLH